LCHCGQAARGAATAGYGRVRRHQQECGESGDLNLKPALRRAGPRPTLTTAPDGPASVRIPSRGAPGEMREPGPARPAQTCHVSWPSRLDGACTLWVISRGLGSALQAKSPGPGLATFKFAASNVQHAALVLHSLSRFRRRPLPLNSEWGAASSSECRHWHRWAGCNGHATQTVNRAQHGWMGSARMLRCRARRGQLSLG
jgi:hypothetical protein